MEGSAESGVARLSDAAPRTLTPDREASTGLIWKVHVIL